jgi:acetyl esterase/lipase
MPVGYLVTVALVAWCTPVRRPSLLVHRDQDTLVLVEDARRFAEGLRGASADPVVYAELPGAQHVFDLFHSLRFEAVVDAVEAFAAWLRSQLPS